MREKEDYKTEECREAIVTITAGKTETISMGSAETCRTTCIGITKQ